MLGYNLYGPEILVRFSYSNTWEKIAPKMEACVDVSTKQWEASSTMRIDHPNIEFHYVGGKYITDEDVIAWLENEKNIESMKRVKEWAIQYGEECRKVEEELKKKRAEKFVNDAVSQYGEYLDNEEKVKKMIARRDELVSRYQS